MQCNEHMRIALSAKNKSLTDEKNVSTFENKEKEQARLPRKNGIC